MPKLPYTMPPSSLMRELREVSIDAAALGNELTRTNNLPPEKFPAEQMQELMVELQSLPSGTAEGCRQPLEYARSRLPAIRRQFILTEAQSQYSSADAATPPPLTRGMTIDVRIGALINSVTTALDEYRALASLEDEDAADTSPSLEIDAMASDEVAAMAAARKTEQLLNAHVDRLGAIAEPTSTTAESLSRQMRDTRGMLSLARIELRMPAFVPRWYRKTVETVSDYPKLLRKTARAMRMGVDVARPLIDAWHQYEHGFYGLVLDSIDEAAAGLSAVAQKWEDGRGNEDTSSVPDSKKPISSGDFRQNSIVLDLTQFGGQVSQIPLLENIRVDDFLDTVYFEILKNYQIRAYTYNIEWVLFDEDRKKSLLQIGTMWAKLHKQERDDRLLATIGLGVNSTLKALKIAKRTPVKVLRNS